MDGEEMSSHIFVEYDLKITDVNKYKDNNEAEFLDTLQERICTREVPIKLITDNAPIYRGWSVTKKLENHYCSCVAI